MRCPWEHRINDGTDPDMTMSCWMECRSCGDLDGECWEGHDATPDHVGVASAMPVT